VIAVALQQFRQLEDEAQGKPVFIAEIGWPSRSGEVDSSRSGMEHAAAFAQAWMQVGACSMPYAFL
jgi:exo-beta-1,3-glucanase (GH17 family)